MSACAEQTTMEVLVRIPGVALIGAALFLLVACGNEEPAPVAPSQTPTGVAQYDRLCEEKNMKMALKTPRGAACVIWEVGQGGTTLHAFLWDAPGDASTVIMAGGRSLAEADGTVVEAQAPVPCTTDGKAAVVLRQAGQPDQDIATITC